MSSRPSLKNIFNASNALTLQTSLKLKFYTVSRQIFKTVYKGRLRDVESVNYLQEWFHTRSQDRSPRSFIKDSLGTFIASILQEWSQTRSQDWSFRPFVMDRFRTSKALTLEMSSIVASNRFSIWVFNDIYIYIYKEPLQDILKA